MIDIHTHILPGIDDGACDWEHSLEMARLAVEDGIEAVVCTPHWGCGGYDTTRKNVLRLFDTFRKRLADNHIPLEVFPGAELRLSSEIPGQIWDGTALTINDTGRYALIELPHDFLPQDMERLFESLLYQNVTPIISHPERNLGFLHDSQRLYRLIEMGVRTQITAASLLGGFGREVRRFAVFLLEHHMAHVLATDAHNTKTRAPKLFAALKEVECLLGQEPARQMVDDIPRKILQGEPFTPLELVRIEAATSFAFVRRAISFLMPWKSART